MQKKPNETDLIEYALRCGLSPQAAREWAKNELKSKPAAKPQAVTHTPSMFEAGGAR